ncbi:MAG: anthranilate phosphoribosyltransferase [Phycisphaerae bacterium]|nr:anthranilate phosphoribosyltransferase [Phycisphaerae bacterium]
MITEVLNKLIAKQDLSQKEIYSVMDKILEGELTPTQIGAFITALACKGETFEELAGAATCMRAKAIHIQPTFMPVVDTCGTGGDGKNTFNISTTAAIVAAGAGVRIAKHGNRSVSSACGSADVLEELGVNLKVDPETVEMAINEIGIGFMFAPNYHQAMKYAVGPRKELGIRSIFNMVGPLSNPAGADRQVMGVYAAGLTEMFAQALQLVGVKRAFVVHGHDGMDEITVCDATRVSELRDGQVQTYDIFPEQYFDNLYDTEEISGGDVKFNAQLIRDILDGAKGANRDIVVINAAAAIVAADLADDLRQGVTMAAAAIDSGNAKEKLASLIEMTK